MADINLKLLQTFLLAAEYGSFRRAAEESNRSPSAISMQIRDLEAQIGINLFVRGAKRASLTPEGQILFNQISRAMGELNGSLNRLVEIVARRRGKVQIACAPTLAATRLPGILATFKRRFPRSVVEVKEVSTQSALPLVKEQEVEFYIGPHQPNLAEFQFEALMNDPLLVAFSPALDRGEAKLKLSRLADQPLILLNRKTAVRALLDRLLEIEGVEVEAQYEVESAQTGLALARAGLGVFVVPSIAVDPADTELVIVPLDHPSASRNVGVISARGYVYHSYSELLLELIRTDLRN